MVDPKVIQQQLKELHFGSSMWNQAELRELPNIIHEGEKISECVNGYYEGGMALLVATEMRVLLIDKKPLNYLNVEDLRFDMINEIDYNHRMMGAAITITTGSKTLRFRSYNQQRLRHLINLVQEHMSTAKKEQSTKADTQQQHLEEINKQLRQYLMAQQEQLQRLADNTQQQQPQGQPAAQYEAPKPSPELSDYLLAQRLLERFEQQQQQQQAPQGQPSAQPAQPVQAATPEVPQQRSAPAQPVNPADLVEDAKREVFGHPAAGPKPVVNPTDGRLYNGLEINPLKIAYSKLPMMLRNRKFGIARPSLPAVPSRRTTSPGPTY